MKEFKQFNHSSCFSYLIVSGSGNAILVDPHLSLVDMYLDYCRDNGISLKKVIDTHTHADHLSGASVLKKKLNIPVLGHKKSVSEVLTERVDDSETITLDDTGIKVLYTPGHTDECICLLCEKKLMTADTLLIGSVGRTDFQNGDPGLAYDSLERIAELPDETEIYPGHDYKGNRQSVLISEKKANRFLKYSNRNKFVSDMKALNIPKPANMDYIVRANQDGTVAEIRKINVQDMKKKMEDEEPLTILDVRSASELNQVKVENAVHIPLQELPGRISELKNDGREIITLCRTGNRAAVAAQALVQAGFANISLMEGGIVALEKGGYPVIKSKIKWEVERQVRFMAGLLVFGFSAAALLVNPWFALGSLFVGGGLVFASITNTCGMAALLMKLPYNRLDISVTAQGAACSVGEPESGGGCSVENSSSGETCSIKPESRIQVKGSSSDGGCSV